MRSVKVALAGGLTVLLLTIGLTLLGSPLSVARTNRPPGRPEEPIATANSSASYCQDAETLPRATSAIRVWLDAVAGPRVTLGVYSRGRRVTSGAHGSGWVGGSVTVPVKPLDRTVYDVTVCISFVVQDETVTLQGTNEPKRLWIEYLRPGRQTWASLAGTIAYHMGLGRAAPGTWIVFLAIALVVAVSMLTSRLLIRELP